MSFFQVGVSNISVPTSRFAPLSCGSNNTKRLHKVREAMTSIESNPGSLKVRLFNPLCFCMTCQFCCKIWLKLSARKERVSGGGLMQLAIKNYLSLGPARDPGVPARFREYR